MTPTSLYETRSESGRLRRQAERLVEISPEPVRSIYQLESESTFTPYDVKLPDGTVRTIQLQDGTSPKGLTELVIQEFYRKK